MDIRRFKTGDEMALLRVFQSAVRETAARDYTAKQTAAWAPADINPGQWACQISVLKPFIAEINDEIAGYADLQANGLIDHFYVAAHYARQGVGTRLMQHIKAEARGLGISELTSEVSITAEPFFTRFGFKVEKRQCPVRRGVTLQNALMRINLLDQPE
jgi:putative acetyltransferase